MRPPPEQAIPSDRQPHGTDTYPWDKAAAAANRAEASAMVLTFFAYEDYHFSSDIFHAYLDNHDEGWVYTIGSQYADQILATDDVRRLEQELRGRIVKEATDNAIRDPSVIGATRELTTGWEVAYPTNDHDVTFALAHFSVAIGSDTTTRKSSQDGLLEVTVRYVVYIYDYYYYHLHRIIDFKDPKYTAMVNVDVDMRQLEAAGWARSFRARGQSPVRTWTELTRLP
jgi:hypothetical protein